MLKDFKAFVMRGNVLDLAVAVILGAAFGKIVTSFVEDLLMPPLRSAIAEYGRLGFLRRLTVEPAALGVTAGLVGAAALIFVPDLYAGRGVATRVPHRVSTG